MNDILFKARLISTGEWVIGTYHYSADNKHHYILNREQFLERDGDEMALHKKEVHIVDAASVIQVLPEPVVVTDWEYKIKRFLHLSRYDSNMPTEHKKKVLDDFVAFINGDDNKDKWYTGNNPETITI